MTPSLTEELYREMTAQYIEGLAHSVNIGLGQMDDKSRRRITRKLQQSADQTRRPKQGIRMSELMKAMPVVDEPLEDRSKIVVKTMDDYLKERKQKALAEKTQAEAIPRPPGRH